MAISFMRTTPLSHPSGGGRGASAHIAYRACDELLCTRNGESYNYEPKRSLILDGRENKSLCSFLVGDTANISIQQFADSLEKAELKKDGTEKKTARWGREYVISLPPELLASSNIDLAKRFAEKLVDKYGVACHVAIHKPDPLRHGELRSEESEKNFHAHVTVSERKMVNGEFEGKKIREMNHKDDLESLKEWYFEEVNKELQKRGEPEMQKRHPDHISQIHMGHEISAMERKGEPTRVGEINKLIIQHNSLLGDPQADAQLGNLKQLIDQKKAELKAPTVVKQKGYHVIEQYRTKSKEIHTEQREVSRLERDSRELRDYAEEVGSRGIQESEIERINKQIERRKRELEEASQGRNGQAESNGRVYIEVAREQQRSARQKLESTRARLESGIRQDRSRIGEAIRATAEWVSAPIKRIAERVRSVCLVRRRVQRDISNLEISRRERRHREVSFDRWSGSGNRPEEGHNPDSRSTQSLEGQAHERNSGQDKRHNGRDRLRGTLEKEPVAPTPPDPMGKIFDRIDEATTKGLLDGLSVSIEENANLKKSLQKSASEITKKIARRTDIGQRAKLEEARELAESYGRKWDTEQFNRNEWKEACGLAERGKSGKMIKLIEKSIASPKELEKIQQKEQSKGIER